MYFNKINHYKFTLFPQNKKKNIEEKKRRIHHTAIKPK